ncbi:MAG: FGGY family carbohydrate kinase [Candidatus Nezhaarchaeota archaeon]|nr:FGGY family carbohydrate kinase [Candidatus Nezhaarchaeota archaeon]MCX8141405.1 FGGY family carbohydrate kinase [Candidatus Nezhaarchaeota archaeon]MDW8049671.1 FGGY family carbohydrate kinase [Nitrososphaerota archaeon]
MHNGNYYLIVDAGTTAIKAFAYNDHDEIIKYVQYNVPTRFPQPGWVEQDPVKYWEIVQDGIATLCNDLGKPLAIGIASQRATTIVWDKVSKEPLYNMITWQDARCTDLAEQLSREPIIRMGRVLGRLTEKITKFLPILERHDIIKYLISIANAGLKSNQPALHLRWLIDNVPDISRAIANKETVFGTLDSWLLWNLIHKHVTDYTNASATGLFDPFRLRWSEMVLKVLGLPRHIVPTLIDNSGILGTADVAMGAPVTAVIADQQSSLFSVGGAKAGTAKMTSGTGTFIDVNVGEDPRPAVMGVYPMVAIKVGGTVRYLVEGIVPATGSVIDWLLEVGLIEDVEVAGKVAEGTETSFGVTFIPSLAGLGTPYWVQDALGCIFGLSRGVRREHLIKATFEGLAFMLAETLKAVEKVAKTPISHVMADGNASKHDALLQLTSDFSGKVVVRVRNLEGSSRGAFLLARSSIKGLSVESCWIQPEVERVFKPREGKRVNLDRLQRALSTCIEISKSR